MSALFCVFGGYLVGSIAFAVVVSRLMGLPDPRTYGSKNIGATNVLRSGNRFGALATMLGDIAKGVVPVLVCRQLNLDPDMIALVGVAAFLGHVFPFHLNFKGGKGAATAAGVLFAFDWRLGLAIFLFWLVLIVATRYSSLSALVAALIAPVLAWFIMEEVVYLLAVMVMATVLVIRHQENIRKLLSGKERRIGDSPAPKPARDVRM
jgi:glycerol-3-phosphate acyltransferase PlsY